MKRPSGLVAVTLLLIVFALVEVRAAIAQVQRGTQTYTDGSRYEGEIRNGKRHGRGTYIYANGNRYRGDWHDNKKHGQGTFTWADGSRHVGQWRDDKMHGHGTFTWADGGRHVGELRNDKFHGRGTRTWPNGDRYEGQWRDDKMHGHGTYTWADGSRHVGQWRDDKMHGHGTYTWADGSRHVGEWRNGKMHGRGTMTQANGERYEGEWREGKRIQAQQPRQRVVAETRRQAQARESQRQAQATDYWRDIERRRQQEQRQAQVTTPPANRARKRDLWGAIATGEDNEYKRKFWGVSHGWSTRDKAEAEAESDCLEMANAYISGGHATICSSRVVFNNECGAVFDGDAFEGLGTGPTKQQAVADARANCDAKNTGACDLLVSHCSPPQPEQQKAMEQVRRREVEERKRAQERQRQRQAQQAQARSQTAGDVYPRCTSRELKRWYKEQMNRHAFNEDYATDVLSVIERCGKDSWRDFTIDDYSQWCVWAPGRIWLGGKCEHERSGSKQPVRTADLPCGEELWNLVETAHVNLVIEDRRGKLVKCTERARYSGIEGAISAHCRTLASAQKGSGASDKQMRL